MAGSRSEMCDGRKISSRLSARPIPKRGQLKVAIVVGLAHSFASIFSLHAASRQAAAAAATASS